MNWLLIILTISIIPTLGLYICQKLRIIENQKRADYYKRTPVPNIQGIPLIITVLICIFILADGYRTSSYLWIYVISVIILGTVATIDLYRPIPSRVRLILQLSIFGTIVIAGGISIDTIRLGSENIGLYKRIATIGSILWFVICTNAVNRFDGIQGQSSGVSAIGAFSVRAVVYRIVLPSYEHLTPNIIEQLTITKDIALSLGIVSIIYTIIEYKPLGLIRDIGTTVYGFSLAYLALLGGAKMGTLIVTLSLVLFDRGWVIANRILVMKKNPLKGDYTHLHHRLLANGRSRSEVRRFVWIWSLVMTILILLQGTNSIHKRIIVVMMAILFYGVNTYLFWIKKIPGEMKIDFTPQEVERL